MSTFYKARMNGGYRIHIKQEGAPAAICGAAPRERRGYSKGRSMRTRAGWRLYKHEIAALLDTVTCKDCIALAPSCAPHLV